MSIVKGIGLLIIGAIFGYGLSYTGNAKQQVVSISEEQVSKQILTVQAATEIKAPTERINHDEIDVIDKGKKNYKKNISLLDEEDQKQALMDNYFKLQNKYHKSQRKVISLQNQLGELDGSDATDEEMENLVPEPFKSYLSSFRGKTRNDIFDFHNKEDDLDWGYDIKNSISDFVLTHYDGTAIELISVICKQPYCEILVIEKEEDAWKNIMKDMTQQSWWKFSSTTSSSNNLSIYIFLSQ